MISHKHPVIDVCILGAGPHGLAAAVHLLQARPSIRLQVIDPSGTWLSTWHKQMSRVEITTLRSPIVHTPSPDASSLQRHLTNKRLPSSGLPSSGLPYNAPTVKAFKSFCSHLIEETGLDCPTTSLPSTIKTTENAVHIKTADGAFTAKHLVIATNPHRLQIPDWASSLVDQPPGQIAHANHIDLSQTPDLRNETVVVVGGGLSAAHLACGAAKRGADVHLIARRPIENRNFDTDPGWLGPKYLRAFNAEQEPHKRLDMARNARRGGTVPPWMRTRLDTLTDENSLTIHEATTVQTASTSDDKPANSR